LNFSVARGDVDLFPFAQFDGLLYFTAVKAGLELDDLDFGVL